MKFDRKTFWCLWKLHFLKSVELFRKEFFVFENSKQSCRTLNKNLRIFWTKTSPVCQISIIHLKLFSWRKNNLRNCNICFSYFKRKGITDLGRSVFEISFNNDIEKLSACLFQQNYRIFSQKLSDFETKVFGLLTRNLQQ